MVRKKNLLPNYGLETFSFVAAALLSFFPPPLATDCSDAFISDGPQ